MRSKRGDKGMGRRYVWCIHPFSHHLKAGEVFLQGFQFAAVAAEDDARSGDHRSPSEEGKTALDFFQLPFFVHRHNDAPVELNQLHKVATDDLGREWEREDGAVLKIERALVDANWGQSTDIVYQFCRQSTHSGIIMPSHGRYVGASSKPMTEYRKQPGDRLGFNWMVPNVAGKRAIRHVIYDTNFWKSFIHTRLAVELGDKGNLSLYGRIPGVHQLLAEHLTAEYKVKTQGRGRTVDEWKLKPDRTDNHWLDCIAGCAVCASMLGAALPETLPVKAARKPMIRLSDRRIGERPQPTTNGKMKLSDIRRSKNG